MAICRISSRARRMCSSTALPVNCGCRCGGGPREHPLTNPDSPELFVDEPRRDGAGRGWRSVRDANFGVESIGLPIVVYMAAAIFASSILQWTGVLPPPGAVSGAPADSPTGGSGETAPSTEAGGAMNLPGGAVGAANPRHMVLALACNNLAQLAGAAACLWVITRQRRRSLFDLLMCGRSVIQFGPTILGLFVAAMGVCYGTLWLILTILRRVAPTYQADGHDVVELVRGGGLPTWAIAVLWIGAVAVAPLAEELFFRGVIQTWLMRATGRRLLAVGITAAIFGAVHLSWTPPQFHAVVPLGLLAVLLGLSYERTDALAIPIAVHALFNLSTMIAVTQGWSDG